MVADDSPISLIVLVIVFYVVGFVIAFYIRVSKAMLIKKIKNSGRVVSLSQTIMTMLLQQLPEPRIQLSPATGLPPPPAYTIEPPEPPRIAPDELPPPYSEPPPYSNK